MSFDGALINEQGVRFGLIVVKRHVLHDEVAQRGVQSLGRRIWGDVPIVLMAQDHTGRPTYLGRPDIVRFLAMLDMRRIPMRRWTVAA